MRFIVHPGSHCITVAAVVEIWIGMLGPMRQSMPMFVYAVIGDRVLRANTHNYRLILKFKYIPNYFN